MSIVLGCMITNYFIVFIFMLTGSDYVFSKLLYLLMNIAIPIVLTVNYIEVIHGLNTI